jgi:hypothetical protein
MSAPKFLQVTILVAAEGTMELPEAIRSPADLDVVAAKLNSTPESELRVSTTSPSCHKLQN